MRRDQIRSVANGIAERLPPAAPGQGGDPTFGMQRHAFSELGDLPLLPFGLAGAWPEDYAGGHPGGQTSRSRGFRPGEKAVERKTKSKFNKAVSKVYKVLKKNAPKMKRQTLFSKATKIASKANPATKSRIGKGKSFAQKTARKVRKSVWGTIRRKK